MLAGLLCVFQIIEIGAGTTFNVDEKDFTDSLYAIIQKMQEQPIDLTDFLTFLKCAHLVFIQKKQFANEVINAFVKRLALFQMHLPPTEQAGVLLLIKQMMNKYSTARSCMLEADEDALDQGFGQSTLQYRSNINDPALSNAGDSHAIFEFLSTYNLFASKPSCIQFKLIKSILQSDGLPNELLGISPLQLVKNIKEQQSSWQ